MVLKSLFYVMFGLQLKWTLAWSDTVRAEAALREPNLDTLCAGHKSCDQLSASCLDCTFPANCQYGQSVPVRCTPKPGVRCVGVSHFIRMAVCSYCFLVDAVHHHCDGVFNCSSLAAPPNHLVPSVCRIDESVICLGRRTFFKRIRCNWTSGYKWWKALLLSITMGGFGVDRFYLGLWRSGLGKLFSFGGLGVWTLVDMILIAVGYVGPADGSVYM